MKIIEKNGGPKIAFAVNGNNVTFGEGELILNVERWERDDENNIDICRDKFGNLVMGTVPGLAQSYCAQIHIPPREFELVESEADEMDTPVSAMVASADEDSDETVEMVDAMSELRGINKKRIPLPFDITKCTLTLWAGSCETEAKHE